MIGSIKDKNEGVNPDRYFLFGCKFERSLQKKSTSVLETKVTNLFF